MKKILVVTTLLLVVISTSVVLYLNETESQQVYYKKPLTFSKETKIYIQPLGNVSQDYIETSVSAIEEFYHFECEVLEPQSLTTDLLSPSKTRYSGDKIIEKYNFPTRYFVLTEVDITSTKGENPEWGVLGLGFCPGKVCVVSTYRMGRNVSNSLKHERLKKVTFHEIGHTLGLPHCENSSECLMNDPKGTVKTIDSETKLCERCSSIIGM